MSNVPRCWIDTSSWGLCEWGGRWPGGGIVLKRAYLAFRVPHVWSRGSLAQVPRYEAQYVCCQQSRLNR